MTMVFACYVQVNRSFKDTNKLKLTMACVSIRNVFTFSCVYIFATLLYSLAQSINYNYCRRNIFFFLLFKDSFLCYTLKNIINIIEVTTSKHLEIASGPEGWR